MRNPLPYPFRLRKTLTTRQRITAYALLAFSGITGIVCVTVIFALADLGTPSLLPWIVWLLFGFGPFVIALEEYGEREQEEQEASDAPAEDSSPAPETLTRPAPPRLRLVPTNPARDDDYPYDQEADPRDHPRKAV